MTNDIETFTKVDQRKNRNLAGVCSGEDTVSNAREGCLGRVTRAEAMLGWGKEMIRGEVIMELALNRPLHYLGDDGDDGYGAIVRRIGRIAGLVDWMDKGVLPGFRDNVGGETGVNKM